MLAWTLDAASASSLVDRVIVSTDDSEIADVAKACGADVPFVRPAALAQDDTPDLPVLLHAIQWLEENQNFSPDIVVWLRPTVPLRLPADIDSTIELLAASGADCVRSVCIVEHHPFWMKRVEDDGRLATLVPDHDERTYYNRQTLPPVYRLNGAVDAIWCTRLSEGADEGRLFWGWPDVRAFVMPVERSIDIDTELDFVTAEYIVKRSLRP